MSTGQGHSSRGSGYSHRLTALLLVVASLAQVTAAAAPPNGIRAVNSRNRPRFDLNDIIDIKNKVIDGLTGKGEWVAASPLGMWRRRVLMFSLLARLWFRGRLPGCYDC